MKNLNIKKATEKYNDLMYALCYEHNTIGTEFSESTENWNLRDMVAECDYVLSTYYEVGHLNNEMRYSDEPDERKMWLSETNKLKRFIEAYKPFIVDMMCECGHCSKYDNNY